MKFKEMSIEQFKKDFLKFINKKKAEEIINSLRKYSNEKKVEESNVEDKR